MSRVVIAARTRMHRDHVCIGGFDLDRGFRAVRLLDWLGDHWPAESLFAVGEVWEISYQDKISARPPHVEDVIVRECSRLGAVPNLRALVLAHIQPWAGPPSVVFDGTVRNTEHGGGYIPIKGRVPRCSTGYWMPDAALERVESGRHVRFMWGGSGGIKRFVWVGTQPPPERIDAGSLVRLSLSRRFVSETAPEGYYVQISGVL